MIYVIVGPSHAGKTSFTSNSFIRGECKLYKDIVWITECDTAYLIGNYVADKRARGSDMIARQDVKKIVDQVKKLAERNDKDIVLEGDKICSSVIMNMIVENRFPCKIYYIRCLLNTSIARNKKFSSTVSESILKRVATKAKNIYIKYYSYFDGEYVDTDDISDFTQFSKDSQDVRFIKGYSGRLFDGKIV